MVNCYICNSKSKKIKTGTRDSDHEVYKCTVCDIQFLYPMQDVKDYYENQYWIEQGKTDCPVVYINNLREAAIRVVEVMDNPYITNNTRMLEVGCGVGAFTVTMGNACYMAAVEPDCNYRRWLYGLELDIEIYPSIDSVDKSYDHVVMFHVLEHVPDPVEFLRKLFKLSGRIYIEIPNSNDAMLSNKDYKDYFYQKVHLYYMNEISMRYIADILGVSIRVKYKQRYNIGNHMYWNAYGEPGGNDRYPDVVANIGNSYSDNLIRLGISDTMICILEDRNK